MQRSAEEISSRGVDAMSVTIRQRTAWQGRGGAQLNRINWSSDRKRMQRRGERTIQKRNWQGVVNAEGCRWNAWAQEASVLVCGARRRRRTRQRGT
eukprot:6179515-Pleurochrysis_carterae.AAC.5